MTTNLLGPALALLLGVVVAAPTLGQDGFVSEADRFRRNFERQGSADFYRQRDTSVRGGLAGTTVRAPTSSAPSAIPRRQAATFGGGQTAPASKPFANVSPEPTVSPYLNLFRTDLSGNDDLNYQTLVRPQLQQQAFNRQMSVQTQQMNMRMQAIAAQNPYSSPRGSTQMMPTGHRSTFRNYSHYYPALSRRR